MMIVDRLVDSLTGSGILSLLLRMLSVRACPFPPPHPPPM
jgi:hypothetical protein